MLNFAALILMRWVTLGPIIFAIDAAAPSSESVTRWPALFLGVMGLIGFYHSLKGLLTGRLRHQASDDDEFIELRKNPISYLFWFLLYFMGSVAFLIVAALGLIFGIEVK